MRAFPIHVWLVGPLVFLGGLVGCLHSTNTVIDAPGILAFEALYEMSNGDHLAIKFQSARPAVDRDAERRDAYVLTVGRGAANREPDPGNVAVFHVDKSLRVVRSENPCLNSDDSGCYAQLSWSQRGNPPPLGIFWLGLLESDSKGTWTFSSETNGTRDLIVRASARDGGTIIDVISNPGHDVFGFYGTGIAAHYAYEPGMAIPSAIEGADNRVLAKLIRFDPKGPLGNAEDWPMAQPKAIIGTGSELMFPGEDHDDYGLGFTAREALDWLVDNAPDARAALARGGCVQMFSVHPAIRESQTAVVLTSRTSEFKIVIVDPTRKGTSWTFERTNSTLEGSSYGGIKEEPFGIANGDASCSDLEQGAPKGLSSTRLFEWVARLRLSSDGLPLFTHVISKTRNGTAGAAHYEYQMAFGTSRACEEPTCIQLLHGLVANADLGWLESARLRPDDVERIDAGRA